MQYHSLNDFPSDATVKDGSGLGVAICKALIDLHDGEIGVEHKKGEGSRFFFRIPMSAHA
jgi:signal transduction histidine kinase